MGITKVKRGKNIRYKKMHIAVSIIIRAMDRIGYLLFKLPKRTINIQNIKRIVVIEPGNIGDFMMSVPAFSALRNLLPAAHLTLVGMPFMEVFLKVFPYFDGFIPYKHLFWRLRFSPLLEKVDLRQEVNLTKQLKKEGFDMAIDLEGDPVDIFIGFLSRIKQRIGRNNGGGGFLLTSIAKHGDTKNEVKLTLDVVRMLGEIKYPVAFKINIDTKLRESVCSVLAKHNVFEEDFLVAIMPGASWQWKAWPPERFAELSKRLLDLYNVKIVIIGTKKERTAASVINDKTMGRVVDLTGETNLTEALALIKRSDLVIGNDSSGIHMAALFKKPLIQLFGPCESNRFAYFHNGAVLFHYKDCPYYPCSMRRCRNKRDWCMNKIKVENVFEAVQKIFLTYKQGEYFKLQDIKVMKDIYSK